MIEKEKIELLLSAYLKDELNQEEKSYVDTWRNKNTENQSEFKRLIALHQEQNKQFSETDILKAKDSVKGMLIKRLLLTRNKNRKLIGTLSGTLSIFIIGLFFMVSESAFQNDPITGEFIVKTEKGQLSKTTLPDSTEVWLNSNTEIAYHFENNERFVRVKGEAFFNVRKSETTPFIVHTNRNYIKVFGTSFNVLSRKNQVKSQITLVEGSIGILDESKTLLGKMSPGYQVEITKEGRILSEKKVNTELFTAWKVGRYEYRNISLEMIAQRLEELYSVNVRFQDAKLKKEEFRCVLDRNKSMLHTLEILRITSEVDYKVKNNSIIFLRKTEE